MRALIQRLTALVASMLVLTACSLGGQSPQPTAIPVENRAPNFSLVPAQGSAIAGQVGSFCWNQNCVDLEAPPTISDYLFVPENRIVIRSDAPAPNAYALTLIAGDANGDTVAATEVIPTGDTIEWIPTVRGGNYVLVAVGSWDDGSNATYYFGVSLPGQTSEPAPTGEQAVGPPDLLLVLPDGTEQIAELGTYCWTTMCADTVWPPPMTNEISFPLGQALSFRFAETPSSTLHIQVLDAASVESDPGIPQSPLAQTEIEVSADGTASWTPEGLAAGRYLLLIFAMWSGAGENQSNGDASYSFVLNVQ